METISKQAKEYQLKDFLAKEMLAKFREAQWKRMVGVFSGCFCEDCIASMYEVVTMLIERGYLKWKEKKDD